MSVNTQERLTEAVKPEAREAILNLLKQEQLPAMPHSALSVLQLDSDITKITISDIVRPIEADPGLAAQVLKFLNSAFFGFQNNITNIKQGIALAGFRIVKNFVLWKAVFSLMPKSETSVFNVKQLWQDALRRAIFSRKIACELHSKDYDLAFIGALLQDMAIPMLLKKRPQQYTDLFMRLRHSPQERLSEIEMETLGWDHGIAAGMMCEAWKIPEDLSVLITNHVHLDPFVDNVQENPIQIAVSFSALIPSVVNKKWYDQDMLVQYMEKVFPGRPTLLLDFFEQVDREYNQYASILQIARPSRELIEYIK